MVAGGQYSIVKLRTKDRKNVYTFTGSEVIITGINGLYDMSERTKTIHTVYGRDGGFETYGGLKPRSLSLNIDIIVDEHSEIYDVIEELHALFSYQNLELYLDPPQRYVNVSYRKDSLTEEIGYRGTVIRGNIDFDVVDPFWYSEIPKMIVGSSYSVQYDGKVDTTNYFFSDEHYISGGFTETDIGNVVNITFGENEGYYEITSVSGGGCVLNSDLSMKNETDLGFTVNYPVNLSKQLIGEITFSGQLNENAYSIISDEYIKIYDDYLKIQTTFDGTITSDDDHMLFTSGLFEYEFDYSEYNTVGSLTTALNNYTTSGGVNIFAAEYTGDIFSHETRTDWHPSGLYSIAYEPILSGVYRTLMLEDITFYTNEYETLESVSGKIYSLRNDHSNFTYDISGFAYNFFNYKTKQLTDSVDYLVGPSGMSMYARDWLIYDEENGDIGAGGNYDIFPVIEVVNRGVNSLDGFDIIRYTSGYVELGRISYFGKIDENKLLKVDTGMKTVREYTYDPDNKEDYINNVYTDRMNKTTAVSDFIYLNNDENMKIVVDTDSDNDVDVDIYIRWFDRYV